MTELEKLLETLVEVDKMNMKNINEVADYAKTAMDNIKTTVELIKLIAERLVKLEKAVYGSDETVN